MKVLTDRLPDDTAFDVVVVGAGGAGLAAALFAAIGGAKVLLVEHTAVVGGTTALSAGTTWVPGTTHATEVPGNDTVERAAGYLDRTVGRQSPKAMRAALLANGPAAVAHIEANSSVAWRACAKHPDYLSEVEGSTLAGRALEPLPFDGRLLGELFPLVRPPIPEFTVLGGMMVDRTDINHLLSITRSWQSFRHATRLLLRHGLDRLSHPRGTRLVMGNALVARFLHSLSARPNVTLALSTSVDALHREGGRIAAVTLAQGGRRHRVDVARAVVLASGGFNRHPQRRAELLPGADPAWCPGAPGHTGAAQDLALAAGARLGTTDAAHAFWAPVSLRQRPDGTTAVFPHFVMDRAKPGMVTVDRTGRRFVNESTSYHRFGLAMRADAPQRVPAFLVCDADALRRYGLGMVRPGGKGLAPFLADGYLTEGRSLDELAGKLRIDPEGLKATVAAMNGHAAAGLDPEFGRGSTDYERHMGDASLGGANPNLGPIATAPFYAVRLVPGDIGAATGLVTDDRARVLGDDDGPIPGLYACGNDMQSVMGGVYPGPGITIGPGLVFAYIAARDALGAAPAPASPTFHEVTP
ncbi:FAD-dependent oxidoreductase [Piscinibacter gummiphilus]|uniref:FAD-binding dehydrogenase n=1 Tax=Piscinibacter gummiphilus TaxID=946333 RepID=A0A1W6LCN0_9BURK|nr:FAD-dependent oxidoreductase [Piscinibacter gummiphilus]ARN22006.1 FAD-binding dehydrogenase [Piscinibacter gummiphilus]ATU66690.1 FAD-binding dehydrogenase [Piscinibacter gummiphilus]GLS94079.1 FAD-binding dehydrogenase [Piscinibacter gummiphilus]